MSREFLMAVDRLARRVLKDKVGNSMIKSATLYFGDVVLVVKPDSVERYES